MLNISNIKKSVKGRYILKGISMFVERGEVVGLLGPNGAGKTTLFNSIIGFIKIDEGNITLDGEDITHLPPFQRARKGISFLPQEHTLFEDLTVMENLLIFLEFFEKSREELIAKAETLLEDFGISRLRNQRAGSLSGGQKRRLEIARSLISNPRFLFLDEPFAGLDPIVVQEIRTIITDLKHQNIGVLITDHNVRETIKLVDRVYIISEGEIIAEGSPSEVVKNEQVRKTYLGADFTL